MSEEIYKAVGVPSLEDLEESLVPEVRDVAGGKNYERIYHDYRIEKGINWDDLTVDLGRKFAFLKAFGTQGLKSKKLFDLYSTRIGKIAQEQAPTITALKSETLEDVHLGDPEMQESIKKLLDAFFGIGKGFRFVAGAKFLHMHFPDLFFICDNIIMDRFSMTRLFEGVSRSPVDRYLVTMGLYQYAANILIEEIRQENQVDRSEAICQLKARDHSRSIPRMIDKFYYNGIMTFAR